MHIHLRHLGSFLRESDSFLLCVLLRGLLEQVGDALVNPRFIYASTMKEKIGKLIDRLLLFERQSLLINKLLFWEFFDLDGVVLGGNQIRVLANSSRFFVLTFDRSMLVPDLSVGLSDRSFFVAGGLRHLDKPPAEY